MERNGQLYAIGAGSTANRQIEAKPLLDRLRNWFAATPARVSGKSNFAAAHSLPRWQALTRYAEDGALAIDDNPARGRHPAARALGRKNWLGAGCDASGKRAAGIYFARRAASWSRAEPITLPAAG